MENPYIRALREAPYNYTITQPDKEDSERYEYQCPDGVTLQINVMKPHLFWHGIKDEVEIKRVNFPALAKEAANAFGRAFNLVKMDIGIPDSKFPSGENAPEEAEDDLPPAPQKNVAFTQRGPTATEKPTVAKAGNISVSTKQATLEVTETALATTTKAPNIRLGFKFTDRQVQAMKQTVAKGASNAQFEMFMYLATVYRLDPFLKEIFFIAGNMNTILTSRDGYLKIAQSHKDFEGIRSMVVREGDDFEIDFEKDVVKHKFGTTKRGAIIGAWAVVYRKGMRPAIAFAEYSEYAGTSTPWKKYPSAMICKCAEAFALKRQFGISGLVTQEEMDIEAPEIIDPEFVTREFIEENIQDAQFEEMEE